MHISVYARWSVEKRITDADDDDDDVSESAREKAAHTHRPKRRKEQIAEWTTIELWILLWLDWTSHHCQKHWPLFDSLSLSLCLTPTEL